MSRLRLGPVWLVLPTVALIAGCTSVPLKEGGTLTSYNQLTPSKGKFTKFRTFIDTQGLAGIKTVSIKPTTFTFGAASRIKAPQDRALVANALDRAVCVSLSDKYQIVPSGQPADLTVRTVVTEIVATNRTMAGISTAVSLGSSLALPVGIPRLPAGLGGLAVEAEAIDISGTQRAAVVWSKGANSITNNARVSEVGDAYSLAANFGRYFSRMLVSGKEPKGLDLSLPSRQRMNSALGGKPRYAACDAFGRSPGLAGIHQVFRRQMVRPSSIMMATAITLPGSSRVSAVEGATRKREFGLRMDNLLEAQG